MLANNRNITLLALFATLLPMIAISHENTINKTPHNIINSTCSSTLYPDLCISSLTASSPSPKSNITTVMGVVMAALNHTIATIKLNKITIKKITLKKSLTVREKIALKDCLETADDSLDELKRVELKLQNYPSKNYSPDDVLILLSAAMTNQETCIDGFSHDKGDRKIRSFFLNEQLHTFRLCSNVLAMIKNMSNANVDKIGGKNYSNNNNNAGHEWPKWLSGGDRKLLQATTVTPDTIVAADGTGNYMTVAAAVAAAPSGSSRRYIIRIKAGTYRENVEVPRGKSNIMFMGDGRTSTIITGSRNVVDGSTTFNSATVGYHP
ncbi:hypothetical protein Leryth_001230 [Lithospermum erythrorhizon]|nr:hypothetical protein Leryth_001230 [Lithospermum erythrorhizon]